MDIPEENQNRTVWLIKQIYAPDAFARRDETGDAIFYSVDRFVEHLDSVALSTVERIIGGLIVEERPRILDLMAGWDSHIPDTVNPMRVTGLGLNENELSKNEALTDHVLHDLNENPVLPFDDASFDVVLNTVSVDYMTQPLQVFQDVGRVLKPNGLFLVIFSNRMFPQKVVKLWWRLSEEERVVLVEELFRYSEAFEEPRVLVSRDKLRPSDDKYADTGLPSDPVYAVFAEKKGPNPRTRPLPPMD